MLSLSVIQAPEILRRVSSLHPLHSLLYVLWNSMGKCVYTKERKQKAKGKRRTANSASY